MFDELGTFTTGLEDIAGDTLAWKPGERETESCGGTGRCAFDASV